MNLTRHTTLEKFVDRDVFDSYQLSQAAGTRRARARRRHRRRRAGRRAGDPAARFVGQPVRIDAKKSPRRRGDGRRTGPARSRSTPRGPKKCCEISTFDTLVARALAPLRKVLTWLAPHWDAFDQLLLIKGPAWVEERAEARHHGLLHGLELRKAATYQTPGTGAESVILSIQRRPSAGRLTQIAADSTRWLVDAAEKAYIEGSLTSDHPITIINANIFIEREPIVAEKEKADASRRRTSQLSPPRNSCSGQRVEVNDKNAVCLYANFCRVTGTPEELILDFGLNAQPFGVPTEPVEVKQRIVTNYFTAKRMLQALHMSVQRHEQAFGVLETDVQKRVVGGGRARSSVTARELTRLDVAATDWSLSDQSARMRSCGVAHVPTLQNPALNIQPDHEQHQADDEHEAGHVQREHESSRSPAGRGCLRRPGTPCARRPAAGSAGS